MSQIEEKNHLPEACELTIEHFIPVSKPDRNIHPIAIFVEHLTAHFDHRCAVRSRWGGADRTTTEMQHFGWSHLETDKSSVLTTKEFGSL